LAIEGGGADPVKGGKDPRIRHGTPSFLLRPPRKGKKKRGALYCARGLRGTDTKEGGHASANRTGILCHVPHWWDKKKSLERLPSSGPYNRAQKDRRALRVPAASAVLSHTRVHIARWGLPRLRLPSDGNVRPKKCDPIGKKGERGRALDSESRYVLRTGREKKEAAHSVSSRNGCRG